ncbi:MAG TPA: FAD:protein FMN transferase, partial [Arenibacter sp.]|nr:FAD:protein FMN transferase [Arenibacter sp.]
MKVLVSFLLLSLSYPGSAQKQAYVTVNRSVQLMGSKFSITVVASNEEIGYINIAEAISEIRRVEKLISSKDEGSETAEINRNAGIKPVKVSLELFRLIERA